MSPPNKPPKYSESMYQASDGGNHKGNLKPSEPLADNGATTLKRSKKRQDNPNQLSLFAMRESQLIPNATILSDKLNSFVRDFQKANFYQTLEVGLILGGENSLSFWTEFSQAMSNALWLSTLTDSWGLALSLLSGCANVQDANSWFSTSASSAPNKNWLQICCPSSTASVQGFTDSENTKSKFGRHYKKTPRHSHSKSQIKLPPNSVRKIRVYARGKWFACIPVRVEETPTSNSGVIALDPGNRAFLTGYDGENVLEVGQGDIGRINRLCSHLDNLLSRAAKSLGKRQRHKMRQAANRMRERISCLVKDLHNKVASVLVRNYKAIFLPTYQTSQMVIKSARKINRKSVRNMLTWSHAKFASHLEQMAKRKGVLVIRCNESYTSKTCTNCGFIHHKLGSAQVFHCPSCGIRVARDVNGARNIMLRALQATAFTITGDAVLTLIAQ